MAELLEILGTLFQFFAFVLLATAVVCVPLIVALWSSELVPRFTLGRRRSRRHSIPLTKIA